MTKQASSDEATIRAVVREMNEFWGAGECDRIGAMLEDGAVIAPPARAVFTVAPPISRSYRDKRL